MIHDEICTYEVAELAKEKGLPQDYTEGTNWWGEWCGRIELSRFGSKGCDIFAPTQSLLQRWLREEKGILALVKYDVSSFSQSFGCEIQQIGTSNYALLSGFATYELALEDALKYALENLV